MKIFRAPLLVSHVCERNVKSFTVTYSVPRVLVGGGGVGAYEQSWQSMRWVVSDGEWLVGYHWDAFRSCMSDLALIYYIHSTK